ncbi:MAG: hypothetical protein RLZ68_2546, partial [Pseudomonadota bacterium]
MKLASSPGAYCVSSYSFNSNSEHALNNSYVPDTGPQPIDNEGMSIENHDALLIVLIDRIARQDEAAFKALYDQCATKLYGLALRVVTHRELAEDVLQEAFMTIWRNAADYRASLSPPMAWLGLIVRSRGLDLLRRRAAERTHLTDELDDALADTL